MSIWVLPDIPKVVIEQEVGDGIQVGSCRLDVVSTLGAPQIAGGVTYLSQVREVYLDRPSSFRRSFGFDQVVSA